MNASNPRTALTTSASRLLALLTGEQKAAGCAPGQAVLGCCLSPAGYQTPDYLLVDGIHPELADPGFVRQYLSPSPGKAPPSSTPYRLWPQQRAWTSPSPWSTRGGRSRWRSSLPSTSTCCCTSASGPLCRPGCRSAATLPGAEAPVSSLSSFLHPFLSLCRGNPPWLGVQGGFPVLYAGGGLRPCPDARPGRGDGRSPLQVTLTALPLPSTRQFSRSILRPWPTPSPARAPASPLLPPTAKGPCVS